MEELQRELMRDTKEKLKNNGRTLFRFAFPFCMTLILCVTLSQLVFQSLFWTMLFAIPFVLIPLYVCFMLASFRLEIGKPVTGRDFYSGYSHGLSRVVRHSFFPLKSALIALIVGFIYLAVMYVIALYVPSISKIFIEIYTLSTSDLNPSILIEELLKVYESYPILYLLISGSEIFGFITFLSLFFHNGLYVICKLNVALPSGKGKPVYDRVFPHYKKAYYRGYFKLFWWHIPLFIAIIGISIAGGYFLGKPEFCRFFGLLAISICTIFILPSLICYQEACYTKMFPDLSSQNADTMEKLIKNIQIPDDLSEEQKEELRKLMEEAEKSMKEWKNQSKENREDDEEQ